MRAESTALIVIDAQQGFINKHTASVIPKIASIVSAWQAAGAAVIFARFQNLPGSPYETITGWTRLRTPEEQAIVAELEPYVRKATSVIDKSISSVFTPAGTAAMRDGGWRDLVFVGIDTDSCVYDSAIDAYHLGFRPWIVTDGCASTGGTEFHDAALLLAGRNLGQHQLITSDELMEWLGSSEGVYT